MKAQPSSRPRACSAQSCTSSPTVSHRHPAAHAAHRVLRASSFVDNTKPFLLRGRHAATVGISRGSRLQCRAAAPLQGLEQTYSKIASKALSINLDPLNYGSFAEIGAGQEVARWFFRVGGAAGTIAKSISAYDMSISDSMYGACARYVTRERLEAMLDYEYLQCNLTLRKERGDDTAFFAFADTVVAKAYNRDNECHGWLGIKYQAQPKDEPSQILIHTRMLENTAQAQAEALGLLGVNLIHSALTKGGDHYAIVSSLMDDLSRSRVEVDLVDFSGPMFEHVDNRFAALTLVQKGLCDAALFSPQGSMLIPQETLYKKNVMLVRGRFRPFTLLHNDMLQGAAAQFFCEPEGDADLDTVTDTYDECVFRDDTLVLLEMTTRDMMEGGDLLDWTSDKGIQMDAFIQRIDALSTMGIEVAMVNLKQSQTPACRYTVLLSNFRRYFKLASYISTHTNRSIVIAMGVPSLKELFSERHYADLDGGILEGFGRLLKFDLKIYVYPSVNEETGELETVDTVTVAPGVQKLFDYIRGRGTLVPITNYNKELLMHNDVSKAVTESIRAGTSLWEKLVPRHVADEIKANHLLGYRPSKNTAMLENGHITTVNGNGHGSGTKELAGATKSEE